MIKTAALVSLGLLATLALSEAAPVVSNLTASQRAGTQLVDIGYDVVAPGFTVVEVSLQISSDGGTTWTVPSTSATGDVGLGVAAGTSKAIVWDAGADWAGNYSTQMRFRVVADDGFAHIPGGSFTMGRTSGDIDSNAPPVTVTVSGFYLQQTETTKAQWDEVRTWGLSNGYTDLPVGGGKAANHPVHSVSWWDAVKWCNARSEMEGLTPVYMNGGNVMRTGTTVPDVNWSANGYRLPTEAEWEKAARGGVSGLRFPWGDEINHDHANYWAHGSASSYDTSSYPTATYHPAYATGGTPHTSPVGSFSGNGYGLRDMSGNVGEWCWDWYGASAYADGGTNPRGPESGPNRVSRGGGWGSYANFARNSSRGSLPPTNFGVNQGFRSARTHIVDDFALIPGGSFTMGRTSGDTDSNAPPVTVTVSSFYLQQTETTKAQWDEVRTWGLSRGYTDLPAGDGKASDHPVQMVSWWDVVKWCNARSEKEGLTPCYEVGGNVMRTGMSEPTANWSADGYRLPTEAEWEKAARGGVEGKRYPWGADEINHSNANYRANSSAYNYDTSGYTTDTYHPSYATGSTPYTSPVGSFGANGFGLYDMAGNVFEWCWDWYGASSYTAGITDPRGPGSGNDRVLRGGSWIRNANRLRCSNRDLLTAGYRDVHFGFRPARGRLISEFVEVPGGTFTMGATSGDADSNAPSVTVTVSPFYLAETETTKAQWETVRTWGLSNGYTDLAVGGGKAANHPVQTVSWWDVVRWCNARSEMEGLTPVYTVGGAVMRTGTTVPDVNWSANGYRLPTEAEWEKAARGGAAGKRFPWGTDTISHAEANFRNSGGETYQTGSTDYHPTYMTGSSPYTSPVGSFAANGFGLKDMAGNVWEWCWDWYGAGTYVGGATDPRGPASGANRVNRGGSWYNGAFLARASNRSLGTPSGSNSNVGFRTARTHIVGDSATGTVSAETGNETVDTRSSDADLSVLSLSSGTLDPTFASGTIIYTASVDNAATLITVTPTRAEANASIEVRVNSGTHAPVTSGSPSESLALNVGANTIDVRVTAQAGNTKVYTMTVTRDKATQTINFTAITDKTAVETVALSASGGGSTNPVIFSATGPAQIDVSNVLTFTGAGSVTITASQAGDANYHDATPVAHTFNVTKATATVTLTDLFQEPDGNPRPVTITTDPAGLSAPATYEGNASPPSAPGSYSVTATIDDPRYHGTATATLVLDHRTGREIDEPTETADPPASTDLAWDDTAAGVYDGLLRGPIDQGLLGAISSLRVTRPTTGSGLGGTFSGSVRLNYRSATLRGSFDISGRFQGDIVQRDGSILSADLQLKGIGIPGGELIRGTVTWQGVTAIADLPRAPFHPTTNLVPPDVALTGPYTLILPSKAGWGQDEPGGDGWATASLSTGGVLAVRGVLGDGTKFTETAYLSRSGQLSLYAELYPSHPGKGCLGGTLTFRNLVGVSDLDGIVQWRKGIDTRIPQRERLYPNGFSVEVGALGSVFLPPPAPGTRLLSQLADRHYNAELSLMGPTAPGTGGGIDRVISWLGNNRLVHYGPVGLGGTASSRNGSLSGSFFDPVTRLKIGFTGVVFQKQGVAGGVFLNGLASGAVRIVPGTDFEYPGSEPAGNQSRVMGPPAQASEPLENAVPFSVGTAGLYGGVLAASGPDPVVSGALEAIKISATGAVSGLIWIEGSPLGFRGVFNPATGLAEIRILRKILPTVVLNLQLVKIDESLTEPDDGYGLGGTVSLDDGVTVAHTVDAQRLPVFNRVIRAPQEGAYTLAMRAPDGVDPLAEPGGDGYGTLRVSYLGSCTGLVVLGDGTRTSLGGHLGRQYLDTGTPVAEWSFHRGLYGRVPRGYVTGKLHFRRSAGIGDLDGSWRWVKQAIPSTAYPGGFALTRPLVGGRYVAPVAGSRAMAGLTDDWWNVWLRLAGPDLSVLPALDLTELDRVATWTATNRIVYFGPESVSLIFDAKTGLLRGSYQDNANGIRVGFGGVLLQEQKLMTGLYGAPSSSGPVTGLFGIEGR